jgi:transmembrane sensor
MDSQQIKELLQKYEAGTCTDEEVALLETWYLNWKPDDRITLPDSFVEHSVNKVWTRLQAVTRVKPVIKMWPRIAAAAIILLAVGIGSYVYHTKNKPLNVAYSNDIAPGSDKATLTLANGQKISLTDAKVGSLAQQSGINIIKTADGQLTYHNSDKSFTRDTGTSYNKIEIPYGGQYQVNLPDGTRVWLNAGSSLRYPTRFSGKERKVELTGEGYFEVAKNKTLPFRVLTGKQVVEVLGTHFNVKAYIDETTIKTTLLEGSVKVTQNQNGVAKLLKPGQQSVLANDNLKISEADTEEAVAWKNGLFLFNDQTLDEIMLQVSRWYGVTVAFNDSSLKKKIFAGSLSRFKNISQLLEVLESTGSVHFKIEGRRITIMQ